MTEIAIGGIGITVIRNSALIRVTSKTVVLLPSGMVVIQKRGIGMVFPAVGGIRNIHDRAVNLAHALGLAVGWKIGGPGVWLIRGQWIDCARTFDAAVRASRKNNGCRGSYQNE